MKLLCGVENCLLTKENTRVCRLVVMNKLLFLTLLFSFSAFAQLRPTGGGGFGGGEAILADRIEELNYKEGWLEELDTPEKVFTELTRTLKRRDRVCGNKLNLENSKDEIEIFYKILFYHSQKKRRSPHACEVIDGYLSCISNKTVGDILSVIKKDKSGNADYLVETHSIDKKDADQVISGFESLLTPSP